MSCQTHFSTMADDVVPWPPWCPPDFAKHRKNCQYHRPSFMPVEGMVGRDGMPLRYQRTPWFELLEVVSECRYFYFSSYKIYVGINLLSAGIFSSAGILGSSLGFFVGIKKLNFSLPSQRTETPHLKMLHKLDNQCTQRRSAHGCRSLRSGK